MCVGGVGEVREGLLRLLDRHTHTGARARPARWGSRGWEVAAPSPAFSQRTSEKRQPGGPSAPSESSRTLAAGVESGRRRGGKGGEGGVAGEPAARLPRGAGAGLPLVWARPGRRGSVSVLALASAPAAGVWFPIPPSRLGWRWASLRASGWGWQAPAEQQEPKERGRRSYRENAGGERPGARKGLCSPRAPHRPDCAGALDGHRRRAGLQVSGFSVAPLVWRTGKPSVSRQCSPQPPHPPVSIFPSRGFGHLVLGHPKAERREAERRGPSNWRKRSWKGACFQCGF